MSLLAKSLASLSAPPREETREILIAPPRGYEPLNFRELFEARFLLWNLIRRNAKAPYVDLSFGFLWSLLRPVIFVLVFFFLKHASNANLQAGLPYVLYVYSGLILWWYFVDATMSGSKSIFKDAALINKVYYPRIIVPAVPVAAGLTELAIQMSLIPVGMILFREFPDWRFIGVPAVIAHVIVLALGLALIVAALSTLARDYGSIVRYILYVGLFLSPVIYSPEILEGKLRSLYYVLNPMAAPLEVFRVAMFGRGQILWSQWAVSAVISAGVLVLGVYMFRRREAHLADNVL